MYIYVYIYITTKSELVLNCDLELSRSPGDLVI